MFCVRASGIRRCVPAVLILVMAAATVSIPAPAVVRAATLPELPRVYLDTTVIPPTGRILTVPAGGDVQGALNAAQSGDVVELQAGAAFLGSFSLPRRTGWVTVRSSAWASLPPPGTRATPAHAPLMAKLDGGGSVVLQGGSHVRLIGLELTSATTGSIVELGGADNIVVDRSWIHGTPTGDVRHGIQANGSRIAVVDSAITDIHHRSADAQAIDAYDGWGPFKIVNNYLQASGENVLFGGWDPSTSGLVASDIEVRGNYFTKPLSWKADDPSYAGTRWVVKNLFELKNAQRVVIDGNIFEYNWTQADQGGFAILFTPRNQTGAAPWSTVQDVTFIHNIVRHSTAGVQLMGWDNLYPSQQLQRVLIQHNLFLNIGEFPDSVYGVYTGMLFNVWDGPADLTIDHNTTFQTALPLYAMTHIASYWPGTGFRYTNSITNSAAGNWTTWLNTYFPGAVFTNDAMIGGTAGSYPAGNFFPASLDSVGFANLAGGDYHLAPTSPYKNAATDGKDPGADIDALTAATASALSGGGTGGGPAPSPVSVSPSNVAFGLVTVGTTSPAADIQAFNPSAAGVTLSSVAITGPFVITQNHCLATNTWNGVIPPGTHCDMFVVFAPAVGGAATGRLNISVAGSVYPVMLSGTGAAAADTTPPSIPSGLTATVISSSQITLAWSPSTDNVAVSGYNVFRNGTLIGIVRSTTGYQDAGLSPATTYGYVVAAFDAAGNTSAPSSPASATTTPAGSRSPYGGAPWAIPGVVQAENFDVGGEGVAYHDTTPGNQGGQYRMDVDVDIIADSGRYVINNFQTGEWLEYTINVTATGVYRIEVLVSSQFSTSRFRMALDGQNVTGSLSVPNTGSWHTFQWVGASGVGLTMGLHVLRVYADQQYFNLDAIRIRK